MGSRTPSVHLDFDLLPPDAVTALQESACKLLQEIEVGPDQSSERDRNASRHYRRAVWPAYARAGDGTKPQLTLVPLERLGGEQGSSGSRVFCGYFSDNSAGPTHLCPYPSRPLVIKLGEASAGQDYDRVQKEFENALKIEPFLGRSGPLALPITFHESSGGVNVLWAPFATTQISVDPERPRMLAVDKHRLKELIFYIRKMSDWTEGILCQAYSGLLRPLHVHRRQCEEVDLLAEFTWYLRDIDTWVAPWHELWAKPEVCTIDVLGEKRPNPFWVLEQLRKRGVTAEVAVGAVHGDLHPRNVITTDAEPGIAYVIDFGWAHECRPLSVDFVLMECNLRFGALSPTVPSEDVAKLAQWIGDALPPNFANQRCEWHAERIQQVRSYARSCFRQCGSSVEWDVEYVVPLFLVSVGLLKFIGDFDNQAATQLTVLELARHVKRSILD